MNIEAVIISCFLIIVCVAVGVFLGVVFSYIFCRRN